MLLMGPTMSNPTKVFMILIHEISINELSFFYKKLIFFFGETMNFFFEKQKINDFNMMPKLAIISKIYIYIYI